MGAISLISIVLNIKYFKKVLNTSKNKLVSGQRDSNARHQPWQGCALPTELCPQIKTLQDNTYF